MLVDEVIYLLHYRLGCSSLMVMPANGLNTYRLWDRSSDCSWSLINQKAVFLVKFIARKRIVCGCSLILSMNIFYYVPVYKKKLKLCMSL